MPIYFKIALRVVFVVSLIAIGFARPDGVIAQTSSDLPDYVIAEFGTPPGTPDGPLSPELQRAVRVVFVESLENSTWGRDQSLALYEIGQSQDPRLAWIISDMMRFISDRSLNAELAVAASNLLGKDLGLENHWGGVTDHLIADQDRNVLASVVDRNRQADHLRQDHGTARPGLDRSLVVGLDCAFHLLHQVVVNERPFLNRTWHSSTCYLPERLRTMYLSEVLFFLRVL